MEDEAATAKAAMTIEITDDGDEPKKKDGKQWGSGPANIQTNKRTTKHRS